ncbi:MAG: GH13_15 / GH13_24 / GH13_32 / GH13_27 / GH13, partial [uncultured Gemmatimonadetes bacterium]
QRPHGGGRRVRSPVRVAVDVHRSRVRNGAGSGGLRGGAGVAAAGARGDQRPSLVAALPAGELQHRPQPLGHARRVRGHGGPLQGGGRGHLRRRGDQPHDGGRRNGEQRHRLHQVQLSRPVLPGRLPRAVRGERLRQRRQRAGLRAGGAGRPEHASAGRAGEDRRVPAGPFPHRRGGVPHRCRQAHAAGGPGLHRGPREPCARGRGAPPALLLRRGDRLRQRGRFPDPLLRAGLRLRRRGRHHRVQVPRRGRKVPGRQRRASGAAEPQRDGGEPVFRGRVGVDALGQGRRLPREPRHAARRGGHRLPLARGVPAGQRLDDGAAVRLSFHHVELRLYAGLRARHRPPLQRGGRDDPGGVRGQHGGRAERAVGVRAPRPHDPADGGLPPRGGRRRPEPLVGQRGQRHRLFARRQGLRGHQPRGRGGGRRHAHGAGRRHLLRRDHRRPGGRGLRRHRRRRGRGRRGAGQPALQHRGRHPRRHPAL